MRKCCDLYKYLKFFTTLIIQNILKDSNYCFDSLAIRVQSKDLKTPYPKNRITGSALKERLSVRGVGGGGRRLELEQPTEIFLVSQ